MSENKALQWGVWGALILVIVGICVAFVLETKREDGAAHNSPLPVLKTLDGFTLTNQFGAEVTLNSFAGKPWIANIFFSRCPSICLQMTQRMKEIQDASATGSELKLVSITTDPDYDQPEVLLRYGKRFGSDTNRWSFLTGEKSEIGRAIQKELLLALQENAEESRESELDLYTHSSLIVLVDGASRIRGTYESMGTNTVAEIVADLDRL